MEDQKYQVGSDMSIECKIRRYMQRHSPRLKSVIQNYCKSLPDNNDAADDILQAIWVKVYNYLNKGNVLPDNFASWINRITINTTIDYLRKEKRHSQTITLSFYAVHFGCEFEIVELSASPGTFHELQNKILSSKFFTVRERAIISLRLEQRSFKYIAETLRINPRRLQKINRKLYRKLIAFLDNLSTTYPLKDFIY
jgi:RNA polymerase sigma factor (sigma-70 family)